MIDEKRLIEDIDKKLEKDSFYLRAVFKELIYKQPQADKWIPCSERLPNRAFVTVWLCFTNEYTSYIKKAVWHGENFYWKNGKKVKDKPIAWMEYIVPQPYKKEGAE